MDFLVALAGSFPKPVLDKSFGLVRTRHQRTMRGGQSPVQQSSISSVNLLLCGDGLRIAHCRFSAV